MSQKIFVLLVTVCLVLSAVASQVNQHAKQHFDNLFASSQGRRAQQEATPTTTTTPPPPADVTFPANAAKGWIYQNSYAGSNCNVGSVLTRYAVVTNTCLPSREFNGVQNSFAYTCDGTTATFLSFTGNANCEGTATAVSLPLQCYLTTDPNAFQYANELKCDQSNPGVTFPQNSAYVVDYKYTEETCSSANIMSYVANLDQVCIATTQTSSFKMAYPNVETYATTANCQADTLTSTSSFASTASTCAATLFDPLNAGVTGYPVEPYTKTLYEDSHVVPETTTTSTTTARRLRGN